MLQVLLREAHRYTLSTMLEKRAEHFADRVELVSYEDLATREAFAAGTVVFTDIDRLKPEGRAAAARLHRYLADFPGRVRLMNDPARVLLRFELLEALHREGLVDFRCHVLADARVDGHFANVRFPVFLRSRYGANVKLSALLRDRAHLEDYCQRYQAAGVDLADLVAVEFLDVSDADGLFAKYSAMRVGEMLVPRHFDQHRDWCVKASLPTENLPVDERHDRAWKEFFEQFPHRPWLEQVFEIAGIEYGRADYAIRGGKPQLWEINTNPVFTRTRRPGEPESDPSPRTVARREAFYAEFLPQVERLARGPESDESIPLAPVRDDLAVIVSRLEDRSAPMLLVRDDVEREIETAFRQRDLSRAHKLARRLLAHHEDSSTAHYALATALLGSPGHEEEGLRHLERAVALAPERPEWREALGQVRKALDARR